MKTEGIDYNKCIENFRFLGGTMILACIVIGILGGIYVMTFEKVNRWYNSIFISGSLSSSSPESFYVICPKCSSKIKRVKGGSQNCSSCHSYF